MNNHKVIIFIFISIFFSACFEMKSTENIIGKIPSPDAKKTAILYTLDSGATSPGFTHLQVISANTTFKSREGKNIVFTMRGLNRNVNIKWNGNNTIIIKCANPNDKRILHKKNKILDVDVIIE